MVLAHLLPCDLELTLLSSSLRELLLSLGSGFLTVLALSSLCLDLELLELLALDLSVLLLLLLL